MEKDNERKGQSNGASAKTVKQEKTDQNHDLNPLMCESYHHQKAKTFFVTCNACSVLVLGLGLFSFCIIWGFSFSTLLLRIKELEDTKATFKSNCSQYQYLIESQKRDLHQLTSIVTDLESRLSSLEFTSKVGRKNFLNLFTIRRFLF